MYRNPGTRQWWVGSGDREKWRDSGYILQIDTAGFLDILSVRNEKEREIKDDTKVFFPGRMELF